MKDSKVLKAGIGYTIGNYLLKGLTFLTLPIYSRLMTTEAFGDYGVFISYENVLFIILSFAIHTSYKSARTRYDVSGSNDKFTYRKYVSVTMVLLILSLILWLIMGNLIYPIAADKLAMSRLTINLLVLYSYSTAVITCYNADASLTYSYKKYLIISGINAVGNTALSVILLISIFRTDMFMGRVVGTLIPAFILAIVISYNYIHKDKPQNLKKYLRWGLHYSTPIIFHGISQVILGQFDRIMIRNIIGSAEAGIYTFSYNIFMILSVTTSSLDNVWGTWAYSKLDKKDYKSINNYSKYYMIGMLAFSLIVMLVSPELVLILGGKKYEASRYVVCPIITAGYFAFLYNIPATAEYYTEKTRYIAFSTVIAAVINIILNSIFIPKYGYIAAAFTTLVTYILYYVFHLVVAKKVMPEYKLSDRTILVCSVVIIVANFVFTELIELIVLRYILMIILMVVSVVYEEKRFGYIGKKLLAK